MLLLVGDHLGMIQVLVEHGVVATARRRVHLRRVMILSPLQVVRVVCCVLKLLLRRGELKLDD